MKKIILIFILFFNAYSFADYYYYAKDLNQWQYINNHTILFSQNGTNKIIVKFNYCYIYTSSNVQILTDTLGNYDGKILIDDEVCEPNEVTKI